MSYSFNLVDQCWIPVVSQAGEIPELNLQEVFAQANELRGIHDNIPLVSPTLLRLLLAILHRGWQTESRSERYQEWWQWWQAGRFPDTIFDYLKKHKPEFDLFDEDRPFYQTARLQIEGIEEASANSILGLLLNQKNNPTLFDHNMEAEPPAFTPATAARALLVGQAYLTSGTGGNKKIAADTVTATTPSNYSQGHLLNAATVWLNGQTLFETLMLNLAPVDADEDDQPVWEKPVAQQLKEATIYKRSHTVGPMERFTFQSRLIHLLPETIGETTVVRRVLVAQGRIPEDTPPDEMKVYFRSKVKGEEKLLPLSLNADKAAWRDAHAIFSKEGAVRPAAFAHAVRVVDRHGQEDATLKRNLRFRVSVVGVANQPGKAAKIMLWRHDRMPASPELLDNAELVSRIQIAIGDAEAIALEMLIISKFRDKVTSGSGRMWDVAKLYCYPDADNPDVSRRPKTMDLNRIGQIAEGFDPCCAFWPRLEAPFYQLLMDLPDEKDDALERWRDVVEREATYCFNVARRALGTSLRALRTAAISDRFLTPARLEAANIAARARKAQQAAQTPTSGATTTPVQLSLEEVNK